MCVDDALNILLGNKSDLRGLYYDFNTVHCIRHAQSTSNVGVDVLDPDLTDWGVHQAVGLKDMLSQ